MENKRKGGGGLVNITFIKYQVQKYQMLKKYNTQAGTVVV